MSGTEPRYLTLSQVAVRTGRHPELLRQWCAADRLPCLRLGGSWVMHERDLPLVDAIASRGGRTRRSAAASSPGVTRVIAAVYEDAAMAASATDGLRRRMGLAPTDLGTGPLALPTAPAVSLTVVAARVGTGQVVAARRILAAFGGRIVADIEETRAITNLSSDDAALEVAAVAEPVVAPGTAG